LAIAADFQPRRSSSSRRPEEEEKWVKSERVSLVTHEERLRLSECLIYRIVQTWSNSVPVLLLGWPELRKLPNNRQNSRITVGNEARDCGTVIQLPSILTRHFYDQGMTLQCIKC
jgi:hypothetical protein